MEQGGVRAGSKTRNSNRFCHHDYLSLVMFILILKRVGSRSLRRRRTLSARSETEQRPQSQYCPKPWKDHRIIVDYCHCLLQHLLHHCHHCHLLQHLLHRPIVQPRLIQFTPRPSLHLLDCQSSSVKVILTTRQNMLELMSRCFQTSLNRFGQSTMGWITHRPPTRRLVETNQGVWAPP